jgi:hypothetical protein
LSEKLSIELEKLAVVRERPFQSDLPVVGPLIAWFRTLWNNVSTRWYVLPLLRQQNTFNSEVVAHLQELSGRAVAIDQDLTDLTRTVAELSHCLVQLEHRLDALETSVTHEVDHPPAR